MRAINRIGLGTKIFLAMVAISLVPLVGLGWYSLDQIKKTAHLAAAGSGEELVKNVIRIQQVNLLNQAKFVEAELSAVENHLRTLKQLTEQVLREGKRSDGRVQSVKLRLSRDESVGYYREPPGKPPEGSNVFISLRAPLTGHLIRDVELTGDLDPFMKHTIDQNRNLAAMYVILEEGATRIYPAMDLDREVSSGRLPKDLDVTAYPFYYTADPQHNPDRKLAWTDVYLDLTERGWMVSAIAPLYPDGQRIRGVAGIDVTIQNLIDNVLNFRFPQPGAYAFLAGNHGRAIAFPDQALKDLGLADRNQTDQADRYQVDLLETGNQGFRRVVEEMTAGKSGLDLISLSGEDKYLLYTPIPTNGWSLAFVIPASEITAPVASIIEEQNRQTIRVLIDRLALGVLGTLVLITGASVVLSRKIIRPVHNLITATRRVGQGKAGVQIPVESRDEIGILASSFNLMARRVAELIAALKGKAEEQKQLNDALANLNRSLERKVAQRTAELQATVADLERANLQTLSLEKSRRALVANVSHDLRTPLTSIIGYVEALRDGMATSPESSAKYLKILHEKAIGLNRLIDDLFELSHLETNQLKMDLEWFPATEILLASIDNLELDIRKADLNLAVEVVPNLPPVLVDPDRINQVVNNIVTNAIRHTPEGGQITFRASAAGSPISEATEVLVEVSDTGRGIAPRDLPHIFDRFYRGEKSRSRATGGSGLGLAIAREIIRAHGGRIWAASESGRGSSFFFVLTARQVWTVPD